MSMFKNKKQKDSDVTSYYSTSALRDTPGPAKKSRNPIKWFRALTKRKKIFVIIGLAVLLAGLSFAGYKLFKPQTEPVKAPVIAPKKIKPAEKYFSNLSGVEVAGPADLTKPATAIMVENSPDARPQSGLKQAEIVYEAIAEGGITRFLIINQQNKPGLIGPVRSLRSYYVDWLTPYNASVAHVGGSAAALRTVRSGGYRDIDQFFNAGTYYRASDRYAPHNVYTTSEKLDALNVSKGYTVSEFSPMKRADGAPSAAPDATSLSISFGSAAFTTQYQYDAASNTYPRSIAGVPHEDREEGRIAPSVVIAMKASEQTVLEDGYRQQINTTAGGEAVIFQNGMAVTATWSKPTLQSQIEFKDAAGQPIALNRGQTWIAAVPNDSGSVSWQ